MTASRRFVKAPEIKSVHNHHRSPTIHFKLTDFFLRVILNLDFGNKKAIVTAGVSRYI